MTEVLDFRTILSDDLYSVGSLKRPFEFISTRLSNPEFRYILDICIKRVRINNGKKSIQKSYGMYVTVDNEKCLKMLVPYRLVSNAKSIYDFSEILDADYFVGGNDKMYQVRFKNPILLQNTGYLVCDVDYKLKE